MIYSTGRTRAITGSCRLVGSFLQTGYEPPLQTTLDPPPRPATPNTDCTMGAFFTACNGSLRSDTRKKPGRPPIIEAGVYVQVQTPIGNSDEIFVVLDSAPLPTAGSGETTTLSGNFDYTFTATLEVEELYEVTSLPFTTIDAPFPRAVRIFERLRPGGAVSARLGPASFSGNLPNTAMEGETIRVLAGQVGASANDGGSGSWSVTPIGDDGDDWYVPPFDGPNPSASAPGYGSGTFSAPGTVTLSSEHSDTHAAGVSGGGSFEATPPKRFVLSGVVRAMEAAYPDNLVGICSRFLGDTSTEFTISGGAFSTSGVQYRGQVVGQITFPNGATPTGTQTAAKSVNQWQPISASIKASSLAAVSDDERATRLLMKGKTFDGLSLTKSNVTVDAGTSLSPTGAWAGTWGAVSGGAAPTLAGGIAFSGAVRRAFTHDVSFMGSRHLRLTIKASAANAPFSVSIGGKTWQAKAGAGTSTFAQIDIDLAAENSETATTSTHDTKWTLDRSDDLPLSEGEYFGVQRVGSLTITGAAGVAFVVSKIELVTKGGITADWVPAFYGGEVIYRNSAPIGIDDDWPTQQYPDLSFGTGGSGRTTAFARRGPLIDADGVQMEQEDSTYQINYPPDGSEADPQLIPNEVSIARLAENINRINSNGTILNPGYTAVALKPPTGCTPVSPASPSYMDCYLSYDRPSAWLFGGGAMVQGAGNWTFGFDLNLGSVLAQEGFDSFTFFAGCGDFYGFGGDSAAPNTVYLCAGTTLRGAAHGITLTTAKQPAAGKTIEVRQGTPSPGSVVSNGTSSANGYYKTNTSPFAKTAQSATATAKSGNRSASFSAYGRKRQRVVFVLAALGRWLTGDTSMAGRMVRGSSADDLLKLEFANDITAQAWSEIVTALTAYRPCLRYSRLNGSLYASFQTAETGGAIGAAWTRTEGRSFEGMATINDNGEFPTFCILQSGLQCHFWRTDAGAIESKIVSPNLTQVYPAGSAVLTMVTSGVAEDAICAWVEYATGNVYLSYRNDGGQVVTISSGNGGKSYS